MNSAHIKIHSKKEMKQFAISVAKKIIVPNIITLDGELGTGKTFWVKQFTTYFQDKKNPIMVQSPTYSYLNMYPTEPKIYHFDFYRLESLEQFYSLGLSEFIGSGLSVIEWHKKIPDLFFTEYLSIFIQSDTSKNFQYRNIFVQGFGRCEKIVQAIANEFSKL